MKKKFSWYKLLCKSLILTIYKTLYNITSDKKLCL